MALDQILSRSLLRNEQALAPAMRAPVSSSPAPVSKNLNRLLSAAVISPRFQRLLLSDPAAALAAGYNGESFPLTPAEYAAVTSLRVGTVRDFAVQLLRVLQHATKEAALHAAEVQADFRMAEVTTQ